MWDFYKFYLLAKKKKNAIPKEVSRKLQNSKFKTPIFLG